MAAELAERLGIEATLIPGGKGIFDVTADGNLVFSKHKVGRFPNEGEVATMLSDL